MDNDILLGEDLNTDYPVVYKKFDDVLKNIEFANDDERILCASIIESLEIEAAIQFRNDKCVHIPYIGKLCKNLVRRNVLKKYKNFAKVSENFTKEQKKEFFRATYKEEQQKHEEEKAKRKIEKPLAGNAFIQYVNLCRKKGIAFAKLYMRFLNDMKDVPFIQEVHDAYLEILENDRNR